MFAVDFKIRALQTDSSVGHTSDFSGEKYSDFRFFRQKTEASSSSHMHVFLSLYGELSNGQAVRLVIILL